MEVEWRQKDKAFKVILGYTAIFDASLGYMRPCLYKEEGGREGEREILRLSGKKLHWKGPKWKQKGKKGK